MGVFHLPKIPLCFEKASKDELFEQIEIFLVSEGLGEGERGTGAGSESMTGS